MKILLISDTHGDLSLLERAIEATAADEVIHAGDFGFYDQESARRLSPRELLLRILHSGLPREVKREARKLKGEEALQAFMTEHDVLGEFRDFLAGRMQLPVPVHAIWGNHEDHAVVAALLRGELSVPGLHLVAPDEVAKIGRFRLFGLGGNIIVNAKLLDKPLAGRRGKIWATLIEMGQLLMAARELGRDDCDAVRLLVTHVSPGKEPLVGLLASHLRTRFVVNGHMGSPYCVVWNEFGIREQEETVKWLTRRSEELRELGAEIDLDLSPRERECQQFALEILTGAPAAPKARGTPGGEPAGYRDCFYVNLPDAADGYAVFEDEGDRVALRTWSAGLRLG